MNETCTKPVQRVCVLCRSELSESDNECPLDGGVVIDLENDPLIGNKFAETYEIENILGYGATSLVYKAKHVINQKYYAVKVLHPHLTADEQSVLRFELESRAASRLNHPNVVTVYESGISDEGYAYFVMDYFDGCTLDQILDNEGHLDVARAANIFVQLGMGLGHAHRKGILHRDLKASNIIVYHDEFDEERAKLLDFGVAKLLMGAAENQIQLSQAGEVCGTPTALSPEQCHGKPADQRSDIYSFGCLMYEVLSGMPPFIGDSPLETMQKHVNDKAPEFDEVLSPGAVPWSLAAVVFKCLEKEPADRYQSTDELIASLAAFV